MTTEEKTSRYNEAIYNNYKSFIVLIERLESVKIAIKEHNYGIAMDILYKPYPDFQVTTHPELRESEDERIRKEILDFCKNRAEYYPNDPKYKNISTWIAWLEKQCKNNMGISEATKKKLEDNLNKALEKETPESWNKFLDRGEQKSANKSEPKFRVGDKIIEKDFDECDCGTIIDIKDGKYIFDDGSFICIEEQGLWQLVAQKPVVIIPKFRVGDEIETANEESLTITKIDDKGYWSEDLFICSFDDASNWELVEQNPAWSEEDDIMVHDIDYALRCQITYSKSRLNSMSSWIYELKNRVQPQNVTVTDEELAQAKKEAYNDALDKIEYHSGNLTFDDGWNAAIWYLKKKNAQPQSQWKPSEEQLEYLLTIKTLSPSPLLESLYVDLKKLREE